MSPAGRSGHHGRRGDGYLYLVVPFTQGKYIGVVSVVYGSDPTSSDRKAASALLSTLAGRLQNA